MFIRSLYVQSATCDALCVADDTQELIMSPCIVRSALVLSIFVTGSALAQESDARQARAEIALSNDTLQMRYLGSGSSAFVDGSWISGTFFLSE